MRDCRRVRTDGVRRAAGDRGVHAYREDGVADEGHEARPRHLRRLLVGQPLPEPPPARGAAEGQDGGPASWKKLTQGRTVLNLGYGGDRTQNVLWRIAHGELDGYKAKNIVLMIGTNNNSSNDTNPANVAKAIEEIIAQVRAKQPGAQLILHPIFPRGASADSKRHAAARPRNDKTNELLKAYAAAHPEITWIDFNDKMVDSTGWVPRAIMADEIHPTDAGYDLWMDAILPRLRGGRRRGDLRHETRDLRRH